MGLLMQVNSLNQSFWFDEVWVANAIVERPLRQTIYYQGWLNTNPPLFLLLVRLFTQLFGISHATMRIVPFVFGILSIFAVAYLAARLLKPWYAIVAVLLFSLSPAFVFYTTALKPYTADVFVGVILLVVGYHYLMTRSRTAFAAGRPNGFAPV
jgi:predicted membrane-bound mannosyltransferase